MSADVLVGSVAGTPPVAPARSRAGLLHRALGALLLLAISVPLYRVLTTRETGLAGSATVSIADVYYDSFSTGLLVIAPVALLGALFVTDDRALLIGARIRNLVLYPSRLPFAVAAASLAALLTYAFTHFVLGGLPNHIDSLSQLLQARFWAEGRLAGPRDALNAFWMIQNSALTPHGWVSQYPPGHIALLALGVWLGAPSLVGAALVGVLVLTTSLFAERLLPEAPAGVRVGVLLLACSPFVICLGGSYMNHVTAAALLSAAAYALIRARDGRTAWALLAGLLLAWCFATRPLLAVAGAAVLGVSLIGMRRVRARPALATALVAGAAPVLAALFLYNRHFFGAPFRFGYEVALGPHAGLGLQRDPWGNVYGAVEAIGYTSADVVSLNAALLGMPIPALLLVAFFLLAARRLSHGVTVLLSWALVPIAANLLYWHHGQFMGPRMLYESAPAWLLLTGIAAVSLFRRIPSHHPRAPRFALRSAYVCALVFSGLLGALFLAPSRALSYSPGVASVMRTPVPDSPANALVFVHDAWRARVAMRLAASGMRLDSVEIATRNNATCDAQRLADALESGNTALSAARLQRMDMRARGRDLPPLSEISPGNRAIFTADSPLDAECLRQVHSDGPGVIDIAPLLWRGALIGSDDPRPLFVRDLGPELNLRLLAAHPDRTAYVYTLGGETQPTLLEYETGMTLLWGAAR